MKTQKEKLKETLFGILAFVLWIGTGILGFYVAVNIQEMVFRIYVLCCADNRWGFTVTKQWSSIFLMLIWVSFIVWIGDYQSKHFNEPKSWKIYGWTYLVMVLLLGISWLI